MKALIFLLTCTYLTLAVPLGTSCISPLSDVNGEGFSDNVNPLLCGTNAISEKLTCDSTTGRCLGTLYYSGCEPGKCAPAYYCGNAGVCLSCMENCKICPNSASCTEPLKTYYYSAEKNKCLKIPLSNCIVGDNSTCVSCETGYTVNGNGTCSACAYGCLECETEGLCESKSCGPELFWNGTDCAPGVKNCLYGGNATTVCELCNFGFYLQTDDAGVQTCLKGADKCAYVGLSGHCKSCENGYHWITDTQTCEEIHVESCISTSTGEDCKACDTNYALDNYCSYVILNCEVASSPVTCAKCSPGYFWDSSKYECSPCIEGCAECTAFTAAGCSACLPTYFFTKEYNCQKCIDNCKICTARGTCTTCNVGYYYDSTTNTCLRCSVDGCESCDIYPKVCEVCKEGYYMKDSVCVAVTTIVNCASYSRYTGVCITCTPGYFFNMTNGICQACTLTEGCANCISTRCVECKEGYHAVDTGCVPNDALPAHCKTYGSNSCTECEFGYYLSSLGCTKIVSGAIANCESHVYNSGLICATCSPGYYRYSSTQCVPIVPIKNCASYSTVNSKCDMCILGYYPAAYGNRCDPCTVTKGCTQCNADGCVACSSEYFLNGVVCALKRSILYCVELSDSGSCKVCERGYILSSQGNCVLDTKGFLKGCSVYSYVSTTSGLVSSCLACNSTTYLNTKTDGSRNCSGKVSTTVPACVEHIANNACSRCADGYAINNISTCVKANVPMVGCLNQMLYYNSLTSEVLNKCENCLPGYYKTSDLLKCIKCSDKCGKCDNSTYCSGCEPGYYLSSDNTCKACTEGCETCSSATCLSCKDGYYLKGGVCQKGPANSVNTFMDDSCSLCAPNYGIFYNTPCPSCKDSTCNKCTNADKTGSCTTCSGGYYLGVGKNCSVQCDNTTHCIGACESPTRCTKCEPGYFVNVNGTCQECVSGCGVCHGNTTAKCDACLPGYFKSEIDATCLPCADDDSYPTERIEKCGPQRKNATNNGYVEDSITPTISCQPGSYLEQTCVYVEGCAVPDRSPNKCAKCEDGYYLGNTNETNDYLCHECYVENCYKCSAMTKCEECVEGFYVAYQNKEPFCLPCTGSGCKACNSTATTCTACTAGYKLVSSSCVACTSKDGPNSCNCPEGQYWSATLKTCLACADGCTLCTNSSACQACDDLYYLDNVTCKTTENLPSHCASVYPIGYCRNCAAGTYYNETATPASCDDCHLLYKNCSSCNPQQCLACDTGFYLNGTTCAPCYISSCSSCSDSKTCDQCDSGFYFDGKACSKCITGCVACAAKATCQVCESTYYLTVNKTCESCGTGCSVCNNSTNCANCSDGYFMRNGTCSACYGPCKTCISSKSEECLTCNANANLRVFYYAMFDSGYVPVGPCECTSGLVYDTVNRKCSSTSSSSFSSYLFTGVVSLFVILLAIL